MRMIVDGTGIERVPRLARAAEGLALRGHHVGWRGAPADGPARAWIEHASADASQVEVVIGGTAPARVARTGWVARASAMVLAGDGSSIAAWGGLDRFAWHSLWSLVLIEEHDGPALQEAASRGRVHGLAFERVALWPQGHAPSEANAAHRDVEVLERACERALARARGGAARAALFVDRDGTLIAERGYLSDPAGVELLPGVAQALREVRVAGLPVIVVSNQAGVGRGRFPIEQAYATMAHLRRLLRLHGVELDAIYFCPHRPDEGCACRKPGTLLLERAAEDQQLSLGSSVMVGDRWLDTAAGQGAGGAGVLVRTGYGREEEALLSERGHAPPDRVCDDLAEATRWFLGREEARAMS